MKFINVPRGLFMKKIINFLVLGTIVLPLIANAQWVTKSEDDIFTGGKKATMFVTISDYNLNTAFVFDCSAEELKFAYIEKSQSSEDGSSPVDMFVKIDSESVIKLDAIYNRRNNDYFQAETNDRDGIINILKSAKKAKSKIIVGISSKYSDNKNSFTANVYGSTKAVNDFIKSCNIDLKDSI